MYTGDPGFYKEGKDVEAVSSRINFQLEGGLDAVVGDLRDLPDTDGISKNCL